MAAVVRRLTGEAAPAVPLDDAANAAGLAGEPAREAPEPVCDGAFPVAAVSAWATPAPLARAAPTPKVKAPPASQA